MITSNQTNLVKTFYISEGQTYRNDKFKLTRMNPADRYYMRKTTRYVDKIWIYFSQFENYVTV